MFDGSPLSRTPEMAETPLSRYPQCCVDENLRLQATRRPDHCAIIYYGAQISYARLAEEVETLAFALARRLAVGAGDRVAVALQNSPQFIIAYYAILRAGAVVVPVNPMCRSAEMARILADAGARVAIAGSELLDRFAAMEPSDAPTVIMAHYADYLPAQVTAEPPQVVNLPRPDCGGTSVIDWRDLLGKAAGRLPPHDRDAEALCVMPYTSGSTAMPKGCAHRHGAVQHTAALQAEHYRFTPDSVVTAVQPLYHVAGMQGSMNAAIWAGATLLILTRWDAQAAMQLFIRHGVTFWNAPPTMVIDMLSQDHFDPAAFARLTVITGGGSSMPVAVAEQLQDRFGLRYIEGYGMSETMSPTHLNPIDAPKNGSIGITVQDTHAFIIDPETLAPLPDGDKGEIVVSGPQVMLRYWNNLEADRGAFIEIDGLRALRTGDLGWRDAEGYFYISDRLKRMVNASGFKVSPAEVEELLFQHEAVQQVCVIAAPDSYRGETVKALIVLRPAARGTITADQIIDWARPRIAAYKVPRVVEFRDDLPMTPSMKIDWRRLQEAERVAATPIAIVDEAELSARGADG